MLNLKIRIRFWIDLTFVLSLLFAIIWSLFL